jgi:hypothetical protein
MTCTFEHPELGHEYHWRMCGNYMAVLCDVCMQVVRYKRHPLNCPTRQDIWH